MNQIPEERGMVCSVREAGPAVMAIASSTEPPREKFFPQSHQRMGMHVDVAIPVNSWKWRLDEDRDRKTHPGGGDGWLLHARDVTQCLFGSVHFGV